MTTFELRPWAHRDAEALARAVRTTPDLDRQFGGDAPAALDEAQRWIATQLATTDTHRGWAITADDVPVGSIGLSHIERRHGTAWAHYWLALDARGQGLATRALASAAEWAFAQGLHRLELGHRVDNPASCRVAVRAGFGAEGVEREKLRYGDARFDVELHARLVGDADPGVQPLEFAAPSWEDRVAAVWADAAALE
ncbi:GNAT family N-acetyltransferase [Microbacterium fluvii]|uniref:GNAT family N-acetyltransferase n=1 Tax=Microbacterium fluvii TaxID=415215 RepID=A0ABW2HAL9_9MICO|nr:GNAT family N-acetyltransferase [Microbacterium fluvii]MCU4672011.1 GNAT family N-acetyltransferase [Microbacterium fluvii]